MCSIISTLSSPRMAWLRLPWLPAVGLAVALLLVPAEAEEGLQTRRGRCSTRCSNPSAWRRLSYGSSFSRLKAPLRMSPMIIKKIAAIALSKQLIHSNLVLTILCGGRPSASSRPATNGLVPRLSFPSRESVRLWRDASRCIPEKYLLSNITVSRTRARSQRSLQRGLHSSRAQAFTTQRCMTRADTHILRLPSNAAHAPPEPRRPPARAQPARTIRAQPPQHPPRMPARAGRTPLLVRCANAGGVCRALAAAPLGHRRLRNARSRAGTRRDLMRTPSAPSRAARPLIGPHGAALLWGTSHVHPPWRAHGAVGGASCRVFVVHFPVVPQKLLADVARVAS